MDKLNIEIAWEVFVNGKKCKAIAFNNNTEIDFAKVEETKIDLKDWSNIFSFPIEEVLIIQSIKELLRKLYPIASEFSLKG